MFTSCYVSPLNNCSREQLFHVWRSFNFDENTETIDAYVHCIRQVAALLGYREPQILEVLKNTLPTKLYWMLFPIEDLRQAVETAKRILTKEKSDRQLTGQTSSSPFMNIREGQNSRGVSFDTREDLGGKIDKLAVMIDKLAAKDSGKVRPFKPQIHQNRGRGQNRGYNQRNYQNRYRSDNRSNSRDRGQLRQDRGRNRFEQSNRSNYRENPRNYGRQNSRGEYRNNTYRNDNYDGGRNRSRERSFSRNYNSNRTRSTNSSKLRSGSRASTNRDRIRCYKCREYDHFARDCPTSREERGN